MTNLTFTQQSDGKWSSETLTLTDDAVVEITFAEKMYVYELWQSVSGNNWFCAGEEAYDLSTYVGTITGVANGIKVKILLDKQPSTAKYIGG